MSNDPKPPIPPLPPNGRISEIAVPNLGGLRLRNAAKQALDLALSTTDFDQIPSISTFRIAAVAPLHDIGQITRDILSQAYWNLRKEIIATGRNFDDGALSLSEGASDPQGNAVFQLIWRPKAKVASAQES